MFAATGAGATGSCRDSTAASIACSAALAAPTPASTRSIIRAQTGDLVLDRVFGATPSADSGLDTLDYSGANCAVGAVLAGFATAAGGITIAPFSGIEAVVGTRFNDSLLGNDAQHPFPASPSL